MQSRTPRRRVRIWVGLGWAVLLAVGFCTRAESGDAPRKASDARPADVRAALSTFGRAYRTKHSGARAEAVRALGALVDAKVAKRLLKCLRSERDPEVLVAVVETLGAQEPSKATIVPKLVARLEDEIDTERSRMAKGDCGLRIDPRTGDVDVDSAEGQARISTLRARSRMLVTLLSTLEALAWPVAKRPLDLTPLLLDADDALVVSVLERLARVRDWSSLRALLGLYRMYPTEAAWETGAVADGSGTNATAKAKWMEIYGHPDKQRPRPKIVTALRAALQAITDATFDSPDALAAYIERPEVQKRVAAR